MKQPDPQRRWTIKRKPLNRAWPEGDAVIGPDTDWVEVVPADDRLTAEEAKALIKLFETQGLHMDDVIAEGDKFESNGVAKLSRIAGRKD